jgi:Zn-dependent metalloprotease
MKLTLILLLTLAIAIPPFTGGQRGVLFAETTITSDQVTGRPYFLEVKDVDRSSRGAGIPASTAQANAQAFLSQHGYEFGMASLNELKLGRVEKDQLGFTHVRFFQTYDGLPVVFGEMIVHLNTKGEVYAVNGKFAKDIFISTSPSITEADAQNIARLQCQYDFQPMNSPDAASAKLVLLPLGIVTPPNPPVNGGGSDDVHLAWQVLVTDDETVSYTYYIDALSGQTLKALSNTRNLNRQVRDCNAIPGSTSCRMNYYDPAYPNYLFGRGEGEPSRGPNPREGTIYYGSLDVDHLYDYLGVTVNYLQTHYNRNGANGQGGLGFWTGYPSDLTSVYVHKDAIWSACPGYARLWYLGDAMRLDFCLGMVTPDIVGHEYGHGVVRHNIPGGFVYSGQTGALDEGNADYFGDKIEQAVSGMHDWILGSSFLSDGTPVTGSGGVYRDMSNPSSLNDDLPDFPNPYPDRFYSPNYYCGGSDSSGVHHNSTVPSHAAYLMETGGQKNGCYFSPLGTDTLTGGVVIERTERIWYRAWTTYFVSTVQFNEAYTGVLQACADLYDTTTAVYQDTRAVLQAVEMDQPGYCSSIPERAPYSAVHSAGEVSTNEIAFLNQPVIVEGINGFAEREVTFYLAPHPADETIWAAIPIYRAVQTVDTIEADGTMLASVWLADTLGEFDLVVDENSDGFYQPWADTILTMQVVNGAVQDLAAQYVEPDRIRLVWFPLAGANHYAIEADSTGDFAQPAVIATVADTSFTDSLSVPTNDLRFYRVRAVW